MQICAKLYPWTPCQVLHMGYVIYLYILSRWALAIHHFLYACPVRISYVLPISNPVSTSYLLPLSRQINTTMPMSSHNIISPALVQLEYHISCTNPVSTPSLLCPLPRRIPPLVPMSIQYICVTWSLKFAVFCFLNWCCKGNNEMHLSIW